MNKKDIIEMLEAEWRDRLKAAVLAEREACAKLCEDLDAWNMDDPASTAAKAIRARGQA